MSSEYVGYLERLHANVGWARAQLAERFYGLIGLLVGNFPAEGATEALRARMPTHAAPDALVECGDARGLVQLHGETTAQFRTRCLEAFPSSAQRGTRQAVLRILAVLGYDNAQLYEDHQWNRPPKPYWSQSWLVISDDDLHTYPKPFTYGSGVTYGSGAVYGSGFTALEVSAIRRAIARTKRGAGIFRELLVVYDDAFLYGTGVTYGSGAVYGGGSMGRVIP